jgi:hypothetical protein
MSSSNAPSAGHLQHISKLQHLSDLRLSFRAEPQDAATAAEVWAAVPNQRVLSVTVGGYPVTAPETLSGDFLATASTASAPRRGLQQLHLVGGACGCIGVGPVQLGLL